eukprot:g33525.t1
MKTIPRHSGNPAAKKKKLRWFARGLRTTHLTLTKRISQRQSRWSGNGSAHQKMEKQDAIGFLRITGVNGTNGIFFAEEASRAKEIEMALDAPDVGGLRHSLSGDLLAMEEDEDVSPQPDQVPRRISRRTVMTLKLPWYLRTSSGQLWWCISVEGWPLCWRRDHQISRLCEAVEPGKAQLLRSGTSIQEQNVVSIQILSMRNIVLCSYPVRIASIFSQHIVLSVS